MRTNNDCFKLNGSDKCSPDLNLIQPIRRMLGGSKRVTEKAAGKEAEAELKNFSSIILS
jgi:hypothetical protein